MRILVIGATGTIGRAMVAALSAGNEIVSASLRSAAIKVDIADPASIRQMYRSVGKLNAVVCAAGQAKFAPLVQLGDADFRFCLDNRVGCAKRPEAEICAIHVRSQMQQRLAELALSNGIFMR